MGKRGVVCAAFLLGVWPSVAMAFTEPTGFMGVPFGSSQDVLRQRRELKPQDCGLQSNDPNDLGGIDEVCIIDVKMGVISTRASFHYRGYPQGALLYVMLSFDSKDYKAIEEMFLTRYGDPSPQQSKSLSWFGCCSSISLGRKVALIGGQEYLDGLKRKVREKIRDKKESIQKGVEALQ